MGFLSAKSLSFADAKLSVVDADGVKAETDAVDGYQSLLFKGGRLTLANVATATRAMGEVRFKASVKVQAVDSEGKKVTLAGVSKMTLSAPDVSRTIATDYGVVPDDKAVKAFQEAQAKAKKAAEAQADAAALQAVGANGSA